MEGASKACGKRVPKADPPESAARAHGPTTTGSAAKSRKKAKLDWPSVEPGEKFEYVFTGTESAIAQTYTSEVMLRLKGQKVTATCALASAGGTGKIAISSFSGGPSGQNPVNFVRSAASWLLKNEKTSTGKGHQLGLAAFLTKKDQTQSAGVCVDSLIVGCVVWMIVTVIAFCVLRKRNRISRRANCSSNQRPFFGIDPPLGHSNYHSIAGP